ncbi:MAG: helix-turn-helix transcriptional regulator [Clostridia bacterium]|nr:helix-turn-helix transcriptional regulator [Clostridia bacterium]
MEHFVPCQINWNGLFYNISMNNKFFEQLCALRKENNLSRAKLAETLNVSVRLISYWENGKRECDFDMLIKIADLFSVSIDYLLGRKEY